MSRKAIVVAVILAAMSAAGVAGSADNSASTSYFEDVGAVAKIRITAGTEKQGFSG
jgi:hypothetical protein